MNDCLAFVFWNKIFEPQYKGSSIEEFWIAETGFLYFSEAETEEFRA